MTDLMAQLAKLASVFGIAQVSFWVAITTGLAFGLGAILVGITAWLSYTVGATVVVLIGAPLRERLLKRFGGGVTSNPNSPLRRAWDRFGLIGLSLLAPITTGSQIGALVGISLGVPPRRLVVGLSVGGAVWAAIFTLVIVLGLTTVQSIR